jgi:hypothetical protein
MCKIIRLYFTRTGKADMIFKQKYTFLIWEKTYTENIKYSSLKTN